MTYTNTCPSNHYAQSIHRYHGPKHARHESIISRGWRGVAALGSTAILANPHLTIRHREPQHAYHPKHRRVEDVSNHRAIPERTQPLSRWRRAAIGLGLGTAALTVASGLLPAHTAVEKLSPDTPNKATVTAEQTNIDHEAHTPFMSSSSANGHATTTLRKSRSRWSIVKHRVKEATVISTSNQVTQDIPSFVTNHHQNIPPRPSILSPNGRFQEPVKKVTQILSQVVEPSHTTHLKVLGEQPLTDGAMTKETEVIPTPSSQNAPPRSTITSFLHLPSIGLNL